MEGGGHGKGKELSEHTKKLMPLKMGDLVSVQNQHGNKPLRWNHTGTVVEVGDFDKYMIKMDGSGRLTTRNRRALRPIQCYKRTISWSTPTTASPAPTTEPTAATPPRPAPAPAPAPEARKSARVAKKTYAEAAKTAKAATRGRHAEATTPRPLRRGRSTEAAKTAEAAARRRPSHQ